jgi:DNA-binding transcriptional regulator YiaG
MYELRELRRSAGLRQREFADLLSVPLETLRTWDSGRRPIPLPVLHQAKVALTQCARNAELLSLDHLAREFSVHQRTLRAAARTGRLHVRFSTRSAFGRPIRVATRAAVQAFIRKDYRRDGGQSPAVVPLPSIPRDYDARRKRLRRRLRITQHDFARRIGAANKAVVYQWESRQRRPSPVFWKRVEALGATRLGSTRAQIRLPESRLCSRRQFRGKICGPSVTLGDFSGPIRAIRSGVRLARGLLLIARGLSEGTNRE